MSLYARIHEGPVTRPTTACADGRAHEPSRHGAWCAYCGITLRYTGTVSPFARAALAGTLRASDRTAR